MMRDRLHLSLRLQTAIKCLVLLGLLLMTPRLWATPPPVITVQPVSITVPLLGIASFSVTASSGTTMTYQWYRDGSAIGGATSSSYSFLTVLGSSSGTFCVKVTNAGGWVMSSNATLNINTPPAINTQPQSQGVTQGQPVSFSVVADGTATLSYQWYLNGSSLGGGAQSSTYALSNAGTDKAGNYTVLVHNNYGSVTSAVATLTVYVPPAITTQPQNQTVLQGQSASFSVLASGTSPFSYQWQFNGTNLAGATSASLTLSNLQASQAGTYAAVATNPGGSASSQTARLTVNIPATIITQPQSLMVTQGQAASFFVGAIGTANLAYQWYLNGAKVGGTESTNPALALSAVSANNLGSYTVVVSNNYGSTTSVVATLSVPVAPMITTQPQSQTVLAGQNVRLGVNATGTGPLSYQWNFNGAPVAGATDSTLTLSNVQMVAAGNYTVGVTNYAGSAVCAASLIVTQLQLRLSDPGDAKLGMNPGGFTFAFSVPVGATYLVLASTNTRDWTPLTTNVATSASTVFTDAAAVNYGRRFYRVLVP
jgi:hypothetical protein